MIELQTTIAQIRRSAIEKGAPPNCSISLSAVSRHGQPLEWTVGVVWPVGEKFECECGIDTDLAKATTSAIDKIKVQA